MNEADAEYVKTCAEMDALIASFHQWKTRSTIFAKLVFVACAALCFAAIAASWAGERSPVPTISIGFLVASGMYSLGFLWVLHRRPAPAPEGDPGLLRTSPDDAPKLWEALSLAKGDEVGATDIIVHLDLDPNASALQLRTGANASLQQHVVLGFPLLVACNGDQVRAILTHEIAHHAHHDTARGRALYEILAELHRLESAIQEPNAFYRSQIQQFLSKTLAALEPVTARYYALSERRADELAAQLVGEATMRDAVCHARVAAWVSRRTLARLEKELRHAGSLPTDIAERIREALLAVSAEEATDLNARLVEAEAGHRAAGVEDSRYAHRHLSSAASESPVSWNFGRPRRSALVQLFDSPDRVMTRLSEAWHTARQPDWVAVAEERDAVRAQFVLGEFSHHHPVVQLAIARRAQLDDHAARIAAQLDADALEADELIQLGGYLLSQDDESGAQLINRAVVLRPVLGLTGARMLMPYYVRGNQVELAAWAERQEAEELARHEYAAEERRKFRIGTDTYLPHGLDEPTVERVRTQVAELTAIKSAFLFRKEVRVFPEETCWVLALVFANPRHAADQVVRDRLDRLVRRLGSDEGVFDCVILVLERAVKYDPWWQDPTARLH